MTNAAYDALELALNSALLGRGVTVSNVQRTYRVNYSDAARLMALRDACFDALGVLAAPAPVTPSPSREQLESLAREALTLSKAVTNTWGCVARAGRDHDAIARFHRRHMELSERLAALASPVGETLEEAK